MSALDLEFESNDDGCDVEAKWIEFLLQSVCGKRTECFAYQKNTLAQHTKDKSTFLFNVCDESSGFSTESKVDLSNFSSKTFLYILDYIMTGIYKVLTNDYNLNELNDMCHFFGLNDELTKQLCMDTNVLFDLSLTKEDKDIRNRELELRKLVYSNEDQDMRHLDKEMEFEKVCKRLGYILADASIEQQNNLPPMFQMHLTASEEDDDDDEDTNEVTRQCGVFGMPKKCKRCKEAENAKQCNVEYGSLNCGSKKYRTWDRTNHYFELDLDYLVTTRTIPPPESSSPDSDDDDREGCDDTINDPHVLSYPAIGTFRSLDGPRKRYAHFKKLFHVATYDIFKTFNWNGDVVVSGGSAFNILTGFTSLEDNSLLYAIDNTRSIANDFDFCFVTKDPNRATEISRDICQRIKTFADNRNLNYLFIRNDNAITVGFNPREQKNFCDNGGVLKIQIIFRLYNSITQNICGFDLDSCTIAFDGEKLYSTERFVRCLKYGYNLMDPERQSQNYDRRAFKYLNRGVAMALPGYIEDRVKDSLSFESIHAVYNSKQFKTNAKPNHTGLAKIVYFYYKRFALYLLKSTHCGDNELKMQNGDYGEYMPSTHRHEVRAHIARVALKYLYETPLQPDTSFENFQLQIQQTILYPSEYLLKNNIKVPLVVARTFDGLFDKTINDKEKNEKEPFECTEEDLSHNHVLLFLMSEPLPVSASRERCRRHKKRLRDAWDEYFKAQFYLPKRIVRPPNDIYMGLSRETEIHLNNEGDLTFESSLWEKYPTIESMFKTKNSGTQLTNSFQPTIDDWYRDLYIQQIKTKKQ